MKKSFFIILTILFSASAFAGDFVSKFLQQTVEESRPVNNVNIGKTMLDKMAANTDEEELKNTFKGLTSIRFITTENKKDSKYYFNKANKLAEDEFSDYEEVVSVNDRKSKIHVLFKKTGDKTQDLIMIALDENNKLTIINVSGKIDFHSISKLSNSITNNTMSEAVKAETEEAKKVSQ